MGACSSQPICYQQSGDCAPCTPCVPSVPCVPCSPIPPCAAIVPCVGTVPCVPCMPIGGVQGSLGPLQCAPTGPCYPAGQINTCPCVPMQQPTATTPCVPCVPCVAGGAPLGCMPGQAEPCCIGRPQQQYTGNQMPYFVPSQAPLYQPVIVTGGGLNIV